MDDPVSHRQNSTRGLVSATPPSPHPDAVPRPIQRIGGLLIGLFSASFLVWLWHDALATRTFSPPAVMLFGAFTVVGLALMLIPGYREERLARGEDISGLVGNRLITPRWWAVLVLALLVGGGTALALWWQLRG